MPDCSGLASRPAPASPPSPRGFTLVELLVVISILVLLAAMLFPALTNAIARAKLTVCQNKLAQITRAYLQYVHDNDGARPMLKRVPASKISYYWTGQRIFDRPDPGLPMRPIGLGVLVDEGYLSEFDDLWCPAITEPAYHAAQYTSWTNRNRNVSSECGYMYLWFMSTEEPVVDMTSEQISAYKTKVSNHDYHSSKGWNALVMDVNATNDPAFQPALRSHPQLHKINVGFIDGHVHGFESRGELFLRGSTPADLAGVWRKAHSLNTSL